MVKANAKTEVIVSNTSNFAHTVKDRYFIMRVPNITATVRSRPDESHFHRYFSNNGDIESAMSEGPHIFYNDIDEAIERAQHYCVLRQEKGQKYRYIIVKAVATVEPETVPVVTTKF